MADYFSQQITDELARRTRAFGSNLRSDFRNWRNKSTRGKRFITGPARRVVRGRIHNLPNFRKIKPLPKPSRISRGRYGPKPRARRTPWVVKRRLLRPRYRRRRRR